MGVHYLSGTTRLTPDVSTHRSFPSSNRTRVTPVIRSPCQANATPSMRGWKLPEMGHPNVAQARRDGFQSADGTDDFLIATLSGDDMTHLASAADGFSLDWTEADYADVAQELGLIWRGDRIPGRKH